MEVTGLPDAASVEAHSTVESISERCYSVYGVRLRSDISLALPPANSFEPLAEIQLQSESPQFFAELTRGIELEQRPSSWYELGYFNDGAVYARWKDVGEFFVSPDGHRIICRRLGATPSESFQVYLLAQALSFALVKIGLETFHATAVVVDGGAAALLGGGGWGKSSLAASFLKAGHTLLTDDVLLLRQGPEGILAYPGPPRIKLFPYVAERFLGSTSGVFMNNETEKLVIPLERAQVTAQPVPLRAVYSLGGPGEAADQREICLDPLSPRRATMELLENSFNLRVLDRPRRERQLQTAVWLANAMTIHRLVIPRTWTDLESARERITEELKRLAAQESSCGGSNA
jgi:hypothetical protein